VRNVTNRFGNFRVRGTPRSRFLIQNNLRVPAELKATSICEPIFFRPAGKEPESTALKAVLLDLLKK
jgi:hypothetical protein